MRVLAISGSLRRDSHNTQALRAAAELLPPGARLERWESLKAIPPFDQDDEHDPAPAVEELREAIRRADAVLISTPEYNGSLPGQLKNALDWVSRPFATNPLRGKPVAVIGATTGAFGAVWAQADARRVLGRIGARVLDAEVPIAEAHEQIDEGGRLRSDELTARLRELLAELCAPRGHARREAA